MTSYVEVQDLAPAVLDDEKAIERSERQCRHGEEIECDDPLPLVLEEGQPTLSGIAAAVHPSEIARDTPFGGLEAELQQLAMDLRRSPTGIVLCKTVNQITDLVAIFGLPERWRDRHRQYHRKPTRCPATTVSGFTIKSTSFQPDQNRECDPEQAVERIQARPGPFSFEHGNLL